MIDRLQSAKDWVNMEQEVKDAYIDQLLPAEAGEYIMISGRTGIGKSILALHLAFCLATGTPFMGFRCSKVVVGLLVMEGGIQNTKDRLKKIIPQYPDCEDNLRFGLREPLPITKERKEQDYFRKTFSGCQVVILDNLRQVTTGKYLENAYATEWIKIYQSLLRDIGAVGILTHHIKKPQGNRNSIIDAGDVYTLKGATEYVDASSAVLLLERARQGRSEESGRFSRVDNNNLRLYFAKHRIETIELPEYISLYRNFDRAGFDQIKAGGHI